MLRTHKHITGGIAALALTIGTAAPAAAMPIGGGLRVSNAPASVNTQPPAPTASHQSSATGFDWDYVAAGTGAASLALIGIGGVAVGRRQRRARRSAIAA